MIMRSLTMTTSNQTGSYTNYPNVFARREGMRAEAVKMMEALNDAAAHKDGERYAVIEAGIDGYQIVALSHPSIWVWYTLAI